MWKSEDSFWESSLSCKLWSQNSAVRHGSNCFYLLGHPTSPTAIDYLGHPEDRTLDKQSVGVLGQ